MSEQPNNEQQRVQQIQQQIEQVQSQMAENINQAIENIEDVRHLEAQSADLVEKSRVFRVGAREAKRIMLMRNLKLTLLIAILFILIIMAIIFPVLIVNGVLIPNPGATPGHNGNSTSRAVITI